MDLVTRPTRAALLLVHVHPVEVLFTVAKLSQPHAVRLEDQVRKVTTEAQAIQLDLEGRVKLRRIIGHQQPGVVARVRFVTGGAGPQTDRAVVYWVVLQ